MNMDLLESAAVAWEAVLNIDPAPTCFETEGSVAVRLAVIGLAATLSEAWDISPEAEMGAPFDWDFAPRFFRDCVCWTPTGPVLRPDWRDIAKDSLTPPQSAAFELPHGAGYTHLEVETVGDDPVSDSCEPIHDSYDPADFSRVYYSLYGHIPGEGAECIGDFITFEAACDVARKLGGI